MELRDIEIFLTLADELHFGRTAERLHITPSRVSHVIKKQERRLGVQLFERTSRTVRLTALGGQLRDELLPAHRRILQALDRTAAEGRAEAGELHAGYTSPWCADLLLRAAVKLRVLHPGWSVRIREIQFNDLYGPLHRGELQLQIAEFPVLEPGVAAGPVLLREPRALLLPAAHPLAERPSVSLEDLAEVPLLRLKGEHPKALVDAHFPQVTPLGRPVPRGPSYTYWHEIPVLVAAGFGASIVAARAAEYHARPGVAFVPFRDGPTLDYGVLLPAAGPAPLVPAFVELLRSLAEGDGGR
jgi:DNA-binding transcriptional LysR family regulator